MISPKKKEYIDGLSYSQLLAKWRFGKIGDLWLMGAEGDYWGKRMVKLRDESPIEAVRVSKELGWINKGEK